MIYKTIYKTIYKIKNFWEKNGFLLSLVIFIMIVIISAIFRIGKKGNRTQYGENLKKYTKKYDSNIEDKIKRKPIGGKSEGLCRKVLETYFNKSFPKARPDFLRNPVTGNNFNLEIDCYNDELKLGLEYNGAQHYKYIPYFHRSKEAFQNQAYRDELKRRMCKENGITLLEIPYTVKYDNLPKYIMEKLRDIGL